MELIKNPFGEVFFDKVQSFDLKLHWSFLLTGNCGNSYNTCIYMYLQNTSELLPLFTEAF